MFPCHRLFHADKSGPGEAYRLESWQWCAPGIFVGGLYCFARFLGGAFFISNVIVERHIFSLSATLAEEQFLNRNDSCLAVCCSLCYCLWFRRHRCYLFACTTHHWVFSTILSKAILLHICDTAGIYVCPNLKDLKDLFKISAVTVAINSTNPDFVSSIALSAASDVNLLLQFICRHTSSLAVKYSYMYPALTMVLARIVKHGKYPPS